MMNPTIPSVNVQSKLYEILIYVVLLNREDADSCMEPLKKYEL